MDPKDTPPITALTGASSSQDTDALAQNPTAEDKLWLFWQRQRKNIYVGILALFVGVAAWQSWHNYRRYKIRRMQTNFLEAASDNQWEGFIADYSKSALGGLAALNQADQAWRQSDYSKALTLYTQCKQALVHTPLEGRILLAQALCQDQVGQNAQAIDQLETLIKNDTLLDVDKAQAAYQLALILIKDQDFKKAKYYVQQARSMPSAGIWGQKASLLMDTVAELSLQEPLNSVTADEAAITS